ncbi:MAG: hypothetical protein EBU49_03680 [Proteobacteria bacterium]|nr:hypothetical protein [Pseudomonadota bacterium]
MDSRPSDGNSQIVSHKILQTPGSSRGDGVRSRTLPALILEHAPSPALEWNEIEGHDLSKIVNHLRAKGLSFDPQLLASGPLSGPEQEQSKNIRGDDEVRTLISSGPPANRIDIVFMGDGYAATEREKFFSDMNRLVDDMFLGETFTSYLPAFNVHVVFRASEQSGIGKDRPGRTAYGLYREGDTLRAIFPGDPAALRDSCDQAPDCDYPVVIANDPLYGGLGGEFAISTSSIKSGTVVLRHELGHNFGRVGEEYDGGGYFGANHADEITSVILQLGYFKSNGKYARTSIRFSASGFGSQNAANPINLEVKLDDFPLQFTAPDSEDRTFIDIELPQGLSAGDHRLVFSASTNPGIEFRGQWLSSLTVHEYAAEFPDEISTVSAFPVFDRFRSVAGYRPTNEACLMRDMTRVHFCTICQENNWMKFLDRIDLIDQASAQKNEKGISAAEVSTLALGQYRTLGEAAKDEKIEILWFAGGKELIEYRDLNRWEAKTPIAAKDLEVEVRFLTSEIRRDQFGRTNQRISVPSR